MFELAVGHLVSFEDFGFLDVVTGSAGEQRRSFAGIVLLVLVPYVQVNLEANLTFISDVGLFDTVASLLTCTVPCAYQRP
eukprot:2229812-Amphidinium_carterae.1